MTSLRAEFGSALQGQKVLVTGATGFIGRNLCQALAALGAAVTGLSRSAGRSNLPEKVTPVAADLSSLSEVREALKQVRPDLIFHLAGKVTARPDRSLVLPMFQANAVATIHLLEAFSEHPCRRFILVGSSETSGTDGEPGLGSPYAASKLVAEVYGSLFHRLYGFPIVCIRLFLTYGPWQQPSKLVPYTILKLLRQETPRLTSGDRTCDVIYVEDVVRGLLRAAVASAGVLGARLDLGTGKGITIRDLVEILVKLIDSSIVPVFGELPDRPGENTVLADVAQTRALLEWTPQWPLEEGLRGTVLWYRQHLEWAGAL